MTINGSVYKEGDVFGEVDISEKEYNFLNANPQITGLKYEKIGTKEVVSDGRKKLEAKANELNISYRANIGDAKLLEKIQELEPEFKI